MSKNDLSTVRFSAAWAAFGDALGFITEGADSSRLKSRVNSTKITTTVPWHRKIGGLYGPRVTLPVGCYSDDTQLRLATSRSIRGDGTFDVEAFAKVELPVWLAYSLGGGIGSREAASSLRNTGINWFSNFYERKGNSYMKGGGNGAAMRIQPHVWAAQEKSRPESFIPDVVKNSICTHGHPRGILGAVFHSLCLAKTLEDGQIPSPSFWKTAVAYFHVVASLVRKDPELSAFWLPVWEEKAQDTMESMFNRVISECSNDIEIINECLSRSPLCSYAQIAKELGVFSKENRGSGTKTTLLAATLSWMYRDRDPTVALTEAANLLSTDTDTIATMSGALLGCIAEYPPKGEVLDLAYIESESTRMYSVSIRKQVDSFMYPDLGTWKPPKSQLDVVGRVHSGYAIAGLGTAKPHGKDYVSKGTENSVWQWLRLEMGQTVLCKRREVVKMLPSESLPMKSWTKPTLIGAKDKPSGTIPTSTGQSSLFEPSSRERPVKTRLRTIDELTQEAIRSGFNSKLIGEHVLELAKGEDGIERAISYVSIVAKARITRQRETGLKRGKK